MQAQTRQLCDELLGMEEKEKAALGAGNLDALEQTVARKVQVLEELTGMDTVSGTTLLFAAELRDVFEEVRRVHNQVRDGIRSMRDACESEIVTLRKGQKAHRAYHRGRTGGSQRAGRRPGRGKTRAGVRTAGLVGTSPVRNVGDGDRQTDTTV